MYHLKIRTVFTTPYHAQANPVERRNKDVKSYLRKYIREHQKTWDEYIDTMLFSLRCAKNKSTGLTPAQVLLGRNLTSPLDTVLPDPTFQADLGANIKDYADRVAHRLKSAAHYLLENREIAGIEQKLQYDQNHRFAEFEEGDWVTLEAHPLSSKAKGIAAGLAAKREGPYVILYKITPLNYALGDVETKAPVAYAHVVQLLKYHQREGQPIIAQAPVENAIDRHIPRPRLGLGKARGRPPGATKAPVEPPSVPLGQTDRVTRSQKQAEGTPTPDQEES